MCNANANIPNVFAQRVACKYHPGANLIEDCSAGDMICPECGLVVGERMIDVNAEWRSFANNDGSRSDDPSRVGAAENPLLAGSSDLSTVIGSSSGRDGRRDDNGYGNLKTRNSLSASERLLKSAFAEIATMADRISLPRTVSMRGQEIFKKVVDSGALKGKSNDCIATSCLYIACRVENVPRTLKEIIAISKVRKKEIGKMTQQVLKCLDMSIDVINSRDFMSRFCSNLSLSHGTQTAAKCISQRISDLNLASGRSPISIAATAIYLASQAAGELRTTKEVGEICGVAESTIRLVYRLIQGRLDELFPANFVFNTPAERLPRF